MHDDPLILHVVHTMYSTYMFVYLFVIRFHIKRTYIAQTYTHSLQVFHFDFRTQITWNHIFSTQYALNIMK